MKRGITTRKKGFLCEKKEELFSCMYAIIRIVFLHYEKERFIAVLEKEIKNHRIIIKNASNHQIIADTEVIRYNSSINSVIIPSKSIPEEFFNQNKFHQIYAFIFAESYLYKCGGTIREMIRSDEIEVFLGKYETIEDRHAVRYSLTLEGSIAGRYIDGKEELFESPMPIRTVNMSSTGILLSADESCLDVGASYALIIRTNMGLLKMKCEVVRMKNCDNGKTAEYGCRIKNVLWDQKKSPKS